MEICIIGFGHAGKAYTEAFKGVINEAKISIIDTDPTVFIPEHYSKLDDISGLIFDVIVIATPPKTHLNVLASILNHARRIIIEKPICIEISQYEEIMLLARKSNKIYFAFHALFGKELSLIDFATATSAARSIEVSHIFFDPYNQAGKDALGGAFWDSIYNVVSVFYAFFDDYLSVESIAITVDRFDHFEASID